jgi:hypothetical protein
MMEFPRFIDKEKSMSIITVGVDLAKNVFAVYGVNETGEAARGNRACRATICCHGLPCFPNSTPL